MRATKTGRARGFQRHLPRPIWLPVLVAAIRELAADGAARDSTRGA